MAYNSPITVAVIQTIKDVYFFYPPRKVGFKSFQDFKQSEPVKLDLYPYSFYVFFLFFVI